MMSKNLTKSILIIDDDYAVCSSLKLLLKKAKYQIEAVHYPKDALTYLNKQLPDLILLDMNFSIDTSGNQGLEMLNKIKQIAPNLPVILITGWGTLQLAVVGMKAGANDFLTKPWNNKELLNSIKTIFELQEHRYTSGSTQNQVIGFDKIIGQDSGLQAILNQAKRIAQTDAPVLILGESGTGKELLAEAIHDASKRSQHNFVKVNLGGISTSLFESEMFGHKKGAFTDAYNDRKGRFELADKGSIFLDEIGDLDLTSQVKLLRVLQEKTFESLGDSKTKRADVRIISATNKDLNVAVKKDQFREDLLYRINLIVFTLPPLRQRPCDIPILVDYFIQNINKLYQAEEVTVDDTAMKWLSQQPFYGNIRELKNVVERTVLLATSTVLSQSDFEQHIHTKEKSTKSLAPEVGSISLAEMEKQMVIKALDFHDHNIQQAARSLGITRAALYRRMNKFGLTHEA